MRFIAITLSCFLLVLSLCVCSSICIINAVDNTAGYLEKAVEAEKNEASEMVRKAADSWKRKEVFFGTVLRHDEIDGIVEEFARLESYASTEDQDDFRSNCRALIARLKHIKEMEKPSLQNIM